MEGKKSPKFKQTGSKEPRQNQRSLERQQKEEKYELTYAYKSFDELVEAGEYNFYGVVYDASFPVEEFNAAILPGQKEPLHKYTCVLKLIDQSTNCLTNPKDLQEKMITLIVKANDKKNMPFVQKIGDIIRVHRGVYAPKKKRNVYLNLLKGSQFKGSWCLFSSESGDDPIQCSHEKFTFESQDKTIIDSTRTWIKNYFGIENSLSYLQQTTLAQRSAEGAGNDLLVHIVKKIKLDDQLVFFIQDETDGCELHTYKYFDYLNEDDIIRIRSFKVFDNDVLLLGEHGNIEVVPKFSKLHKNFVAKLIKKLKELENK